MGLQVVLGASFPCGPRAEQEWGLQNRGLRGAAPTSPQSQLSFLGPPARQSPHKVALLEGRGCQAAPVPRWHLGTSSPQRGFDARMKLERGEKRAGAEVGLVVPPPVPSSAGSPVVV